MVGKERSGSSARGLGPLAPNAPNSAVSSNGSEIDSEETCEKIDNGESDTGTQIVASDHLL